MKLDVAIRESNDRSALQMRSALSNEKRIVKWKAHRQNEKCVAYATKRSSEEDSPWPEPDPKSEWIRILTLIYPNPTPNFNLNPNPKPVLSLAKPMNGGAVSSTCCPTWNGSGLMDMYTGAAGRPDSSSWRGGEEERKKDKQHEQFLGKFLRKTKTIEMGCVVVYRSMAKRI